MHKEKDMNNQRKHRWSPPSPKDIVNVKIECPFKHPSTMQEIHNELDKQINHIIEMRQHGLYNSKITNALIAKIHRIRDLLAEITINTFDYLMACKKGDA